MKSEQKIYIYNDNENNNSGSNPKSPINATSFVGGGFGSKKAKRTHLLQHDVSRKELFHSPTLCERNLMVDLDLDALKQTYSKWVSNEALIGMTFNGGWALVPGVKRGDSLYSAKIHKRMVQFNDRLPKAQYFDPKDLSRRPKKSPMLYIVLTFDRSIPRWDSWKCGPHINRFRSNLIKHFGCKVSIIRVNEAQQDGQCHVNLVVQLAKPLSVFYHNGKWRVRCKRGIEKYWPYGLMDVQAIAEIKPFGEIKEGEKSGPKDGKFSLSHIFKYCLKDMRAEKNRKANPRSLLQYALEWATRSRSYSLSGEFVKMVKGSFDNLDTLDQLHEDDLIKRKCNSNSEDENKSKFEGVFPICARNCWKFNNGPPQHCPYRKVNEDYPRDTCPMDSCWDLEEVLEESRNIHLMKLISRGEVDVNKEYREAEEKERLNKA